MTYKPPAPTEVRPNTLSGQSEPNTFGSQVGPGGVGSQQLNSGGGNAGPRTLESRRRSLLLVYGTLAALVVVAIACLFVIVRMQ